MGIFHIEAKHSWRNLRQGIERAQLLPKAVKNETPGGMLKGVWESTQAAIGRLLSK